MHHPFVVTERQGMINCNAFLLAALGLALQGAHPSLQALTTLLVGLTPPGLPVHEHCVGGAPIQEDVAAPFQLRDHFRLCVHALPLVAMAHGFELHDVGPRVGATPLFGLAMGDHRPQDLRVGTLGVHQQNLTPAEVQLPGQAVIAPDFDLQRLDRHFQAVGSAVVIAQLGHRWVLATDAGHVPQVEEV